MKATRRGLLFGLLAAPFAKAAAALAPKPAAEEALAPEAPMLDTGGLVEVVAAPPNGFRMLMEAGEPLRAGDLVKAGPDGKVYRCGKRARRRYIGVVTTTNLSPGSVYV